MEALQLPEMRHSHDRFTPQEQAVAVWLSHTTILVVVTLIMWLGLDRLPSTYFLVGEGLIWFMFTTLIFTPPDLVEFVGRYSQGARDLMMQVGGRWRRSGRPLAFGLAFLLQFGALTPLLVETGGPIDSPFAQLAVAFAVFTPLLANKRGTIVTALCLSVTYYWIMIESYGFGTLGEQRPDIGVFGAVTTLILLLTVGLTALDRLDSNKQGANLNAFASAVVGLADRQAVEGGQGSPDVAANETSAIGENGADATNADENVGGTEGELDDDDALSAKDS